MWLARQVEPVKRAVAVKLIKAGMDSKAVLARFGAERQALALFADVCRAVQHAHQKGVVHRDLKPSNVLVTLCDGRPVPKVIDFGVAKATGGRLTEHTLSTQFGAVVGTLEYMAPEQAGFSAPDVDTRADVFSLGVILYELLTGLRPFESARLHQAALDEVLRIIREEEPPRPSAKLSTADALPTLAAVRRTEPRRLAALMRGELDWVVMKCLEKDRSRRYETASALGRDVQRYLADEPVEARPPSAGYRLRKLLRRNRGPVLAGGLVLLAVLAGATATTWAMADARRQRDAAGEAQKNEEKQKSLADALRVEAAAAAAARRETEAAKRKVDEHARVADEQRKLALTTLTTLVFNVQAQLHDTPDTQQLKKSLLETALKGLQAVAKEANETTIVDLNMAEAHRQMGDLFQVLGRTVDARDQYQKVLAITTAVMAEDRDRVRAARNKSVALALVGDTYLLTGDAAKARAYYTEAFDLRKQVAEADPTNPSREVDLAQILTKLGIASPPAAARAYHEDALARREDLAARAEDANLPDRKRDVWNSRFQLADLALRTGDLAAARRHGAEAARIAADLVKRTQKRADHLYLATSYGKLGLVSRREGKNADADRLLAAAVRIIKPYAEKDPQNLNLQSEYALALGHAGQPAAAAERAAWLRERVGANPNYLYNIACCYALAAGATGAAPAAAAGAAGAAARPPVRGGYAGRAVAALREAVANGFRDNGLIAADPDLDPVRGHPGFEAILPTVVPAGDRLPDPRNGFTIPLGLAPPPRPVR